MNTIRQILLTPWRLISLAFCSLMSRATLEEDRGPSYERTASEVAWDILAFVLMVLLFVCLACLGLYQVVTTLFTP